LEGIRKYFDGESYFGEQASRKNFLKVVKDADIIHCSTHACLNEDDPMGNRIFFADDEFLTTEEIYLLDMNAKMAVLSACQTGLGHIHNGEGVISLARAFAYAGCSSITMSLWPVADEATAKLMILYYKNLNEGLTKSQALRHAKLEYIETQPKAKQHPYYWAAFVQVGDFSPIKDSKSKGMLFWMLCFGGLIVVASFVNLSRRRKDNLA
jgi:CHAT domain-containing protein